MKTRLSCGVSLTPAPTCLRSPDCGPVLGIQTYAHSQEAPLNDSASYDDELPVDAAGVRLGPRTGSKIRPAEGIKCHIE
jgi:hypothetical protein